MVFTLFTTATGLGVTTENEISWEQSVNTPLGSGMTLFAFVGGVDSQSPSITSAILSASEKSPTLPTQVFSTAVEVTGPGGSSFPSGWITYLHDPFVSITTTGTVTGTITEGFDEDVGRMQGMSAIISGASGSLDGATPYVSQNTQWPGFAISNTHLTAISGSLLLDMCISESSNHNDHVVGTNQNKFGDILFGGPKISTSFRQTTAPGSYELSRSGCGGPFAGVTLISLALENG